MILCCMLRITDTHTHTHKNPRIWHYSVKNNNWNLHSFTVLKLVGLKHALMPAAIAKGIEQFLGNSPCDLHCIRVSAWKKQKKKTSITSIHEGMINTNEFMITRELAVMVLHIFLCFQKQFDIIQEKISRNFVSKQI